MMHVKLKQLRQKLIRGAYTCVVWQDGEEFCSRERGVKPLLTLLGTGHPYLGAMAADKTVGAGAAHLYVLLGIHALWANVVSTAALQILQDNGITVLYGECVPHIINREGNGICPIEAAVANIQSSKEAYKIIIKTLQQLQKTTDSRKEPNA